MTFPTLQFPVLQTERLWLTELVPADADALLAIRSNEEVNRFIGRSSAQTIEVIEQFITARLHDFRQGKGLYWTIKLKGSGALIGTICYWNLDHIANTIEIGYELLPLHKGKGFMKEAINAVITYGFNEMQLDAVTARTVVENKRSVNLLEQYLFVYTETMDGELIYKLDKAARL